MIKKTIALLIVLTLFAVGFSVAEENEVYGKEMIDAILTGGVEGDSIMVDVSLLPDYDFLYDTSLIVDHDPLSAEIQTVSAKNNDKVVGTYRKYDSGESPVIVVLEGSSKASKDSAFLKFEDLNKYNMYTFNSTSEDGSSFSIVTSYKSADAISNGYCHVVADEVKRVFPNASKIGIVSYSAGGYGANGVAKSLSESATTISWVAGYDNVLREDQQYKTFDDFIKKSKIPSMLCVSSDKFRPITKNTKTEAETNANDYSVINVYDGNHGKFVTDNSANVSTGSSLSSDLAKFAEENFFGIKQNKNGSSDKNKTNSNGGSSSSLSSEYAMLAKTQNGLLLKLNEKKASTTKKTAAKIVSGAATAIANSVIKATNTTSTNKASSNKASNISKDSVSNKSSGSTTSTTSSSSSSNSFWSKTQNSVTSSFNKLSKALTALTA